jgi:predicted branched-subunit amino acid permease
LTRTTIARLPLAELQGSWEVPEPARLGLDAVFPAFYLSLLAEEARGPRAVAAAVAGATITVALMPVAPAGLPVR